jgi:hypothetical protein
MINNLDDKIEEIKVKIYDLQKDLAVIMNDAAKSKKWSPVGGDWRIFSSGNVDDWNSNEHIKNFGYERSTEKQAERAAVEMRRFNRLLALRDELCGDTAVDWNTREAKYFLCHNEESKMWDINTSFCQSINTIYFTTLESAQRACEMLNSGEVEL